MSWFFLDKASGIHAMKATKTLKRLFHEEKAGHGGTLDPLATGLLPIAFGKTTGFIPYLMMWPKTYVFTIVWGASSTSDDALGEITHDENSVFPSQNAVEILLKEKFQGIILQRPPNYCARRVQGQRAYSISLQGKNPELQERPTTLYDMKILEYNEKNKEITFEVTCSSGTYVRSLGRDIAYYFHSCAYVSSLRRTRIGPFIAEKHSISWEEVNKWNKDNPEDYQHHVYTMDCVLPPIINKYTVTDQEVYKLWSGTWISFYEQVENQKIKKTNFFSSCEFLEKKYWIPCSEKIYACYTEDHDYYPRCVALCRLDEGYLKPFRCFYSQEDFHGGSFLKISKRP